MEDIIDRVRDLERSLPGGQINNGTLNEFDELMSELRNRAPTYNSNVITGAIQYTQRLIDERNNEGFFNGVDLLREALTYLENLQQGGRKRSRKMRKSRKGRKSMRARKTRARKAHRRN